MKLSLFFSFLFISLFSFSQTTYYWTGGASASYSAAGSWNTVLGGGGQSRTPNVGDVLIFDGINRGDGTSGSITVSSIPAESVAGIVLKNGASVTFSSAVAGTSLATNMSRAAAVQVPASGTATTASSNIVTLPSTSSVYVGSIVTAVSATSVPKDISVVTSVAPGSGVTLTQAATATTSGTAALTFSQPLVFAASPATPLAVGDYVYSGSASNVEQVTSMLDDRTVFTTSGVAAMTSVAGLKANPLILTSENALSIAAGCTLTLSSSNTLIIKLATGAKGNINGNITCTNANSRIVVDADGTAQLAFKSGSVLNSGATSSLFGCVANADNNNVVFESGSSVIYAAAVNTNGIFGAMYPSSVVSMQQGSTYVWNGTATGFSAGINRALPNLKINVNLTTFSPPVLVDTVFIPAGVSVTTTSGSFLAFKGDFINEGTFTFGGSSGPNLVFAGTVPQRVLLENTTYNSTGSFQKIIVSPLSTFNLQPNSVDFNTYGVTTIYGTINFGNNVIKNTASALQGAFAPKPSSTVTGSANVLYPVKNSYSFVTNTLTNLVQGMVITGTGIPANTVITNTSSGNIVNTSNAVTIDAGTVVTTMVNANGATVITSNAGGIAASYSLSGTSTYALPAAPGVNFNFNAATTEPFPAASSINANNLTIAAPLSSNVSLLNVYGAVNLGSSILSVPAADTLKLNSATALTPVSFGSASHISLGVNTTTGDLGYLRIANINSPAVFPIGVNGNYLPVTVTPGSVDEDYSVSAYTGITEDGTPNGTPLSQAAKADVLDAVWKVTSNFTPSANAGLQFNWSASLEGANLSTSANSEVGIAAYNNGWSTPSGVVDNTANTASDSYNSFSSYSIFRKSSVMAVKFSSVVATLINTKQALVKWQVDNVPGIETFVIEYSKNGIDFSTKATLKATPVTAYSFTDKDVVNGVNYYRIKAIERSGEISYSKIITVDRNKTAQGEIHVYPNPVVNKTIHFTFTGQSNCKVDVRVCNANGQVVLQKTITASDPSSTVELQLPANVVAGVYVVKAATSNGELIKQVVVE